MFRIAFLHFQVQIALLRGSTLVTKACYGTASKTVPQPPLHALPTPPYKVVPNIAPLPPRVSCVGSYPSGEPVKSHRTSKIHLPPFRSGGFIRKTSLPRDGLPPLVPYSLPSEPETRPAKAPVPSPPPVNT